MADNPSFVADDQSSQTEIDDRKTPSTASTNRISPTPEQVEVNIDAPVSSKSASNGAEFLGAAPVMDLPPTKPYAGMGKEDLLRFSQTPFWNRFRLVCLVIFWLGWFALFAAVIGLTIVAPRCKDPPVPAWWEKSTFYQVYVRSFYDNDGDGIGDLEGLSNRMEYLNDINVDAIVLSSVFKSPDVDRNPDFNQDVISQLEIDDDFGTVEDMEDLIEHAHEMGIRVIMEFIPSHTSIQHDWFVESSTSPDLDNEFWNYYLWTDCGDGTTPPNNWKSIFGGSAWSYNDVRQQCFLHQLSADQPNLNLRSQRVISELDEILLFWLEKGVDGFRINNAQLMFQDQDLRDDIPIEDCDDDDDYNCYDHVYSANQPEIHALIAHWRSMLKEYGDKDGTERVLLTDAVTSINETLKYYGTLGRNGANIPINFNLRSFMDEETSQTPGRALRNVIERWLGAVPVDETSSWAMSSATRSRPSSDLDIDMMQRVYNVLQMTLPGVPMTNYGEEIGMKNGVYSGTVIKQSVNEWNRYRTPMQWDASENAGFSNTTNSVDPPKDPWNDVNDDYQTINVDVLGNNTEELNVFNLYRLLSELRIEEESLQFGAYHEALVTDSVFSFVREHEGRNRILVVMNLGAEELKEINLSASLDMIPNTGEIVLTTHPDSQLEPGEDKNLRNFPLKSLEAAVFMWEFSR